MPATTYNNIGQSIITISNSTAPPYSTAPAGVNYLFTYDDPWKKIRDILDRYEKEISGLDRGEREFIGLPAPIHELVEARLAGDEYPPEYFHMHSMWITRLEWYLRRGRNLYMKLRHQATRRSYESERVARRIHESRARSARQGGRRMPGFYSFKAYGPKRGWMQGRPRR